MIFEVWDDLHFDSIFLIDLVVFAMVNQRDTTHFVFLDLFGHSQIYDWVDAILVIFTNSAFIQMQFDLLLIQHKVAMVRRLLDTFFIDNFISKGLQVRPSFGFNAINWVLCCEANIWKFILLV